METSENTSTVAAALTVRPSVDKRVVVATVCTLVVAGGVIAAVKFKKARDAKKHGADEDYAD